MAKDKMHDLVVLLPGITGSVSSAWNVRAGGSVP